MRLSRVALALAGLMLGAGCVILPAAEAVAGPATEFVVEPRPVPEGAVSVTVTGNAIPGARVTVAFEAGSFVAHEMVSMIATGSGLPTLGAVRAATVSLQRSASAAGAVSVEVTLPGSAVGTYTVVATGLASATVGAATVAVGTYAVAPRGGVVIKPGPGGEQPARQVVTESSTQVVGDVHPGGTSRVSFAPQSFSPHEDVAFAVVGSGSATLAAVRAASVTLVSSADADGAIGVSVTLPVDAVEVYSVSAVGLSSQTRATTMITVKEGADAATGSGETDAGRGTGNAASDGVWSGRVVGSPLLWSWIGGGLIALGLAMVAVLRLRRV